MSRTRRWLRHLSRKDSGNTTQAESADPQAADSGVVEDTQIAEEVVPARPAATTSSRVGLAALVVALVFGVAMAPVAVSMGVPGGGLESSAEVQQSLREPTGLSSEGLRDLPIIDADGPVAQAFPDGQGLNDQAAIDLVYNDLMNRLGLADISFIASDPLVAEQVGESIEAAMQNNPVLYPYSYPPLDTLIRQHLTEATVRAHPDLLVDLASLLILAPSSRYPLSRTPSAPIAYALLTAARDLVPSCDVQLNLAFLISEGDHAPFDGVAAEVERARQLCGSDPTPLWLLGTFAARQSTQDILNSKYSPGELAALAETVFARLRKEFPTSPLGWTGAADLWLNRADEAEFWNAKPFQVRAWREQALDSYKQARTLSSATGQARAQSALGQFPEAEKAARLLLEADPDWAPYQGLLVDVLIAERDFQGVIEARAAAVPIREMPVDVVGIGDPYGFGVRGHVSQGVFDASYSPSGGGTLTDHSFFPEYVGSWVTAGCIEDAEVLSLIATNRAGEASALMRPVEEGGSNGLGLRCDFSLIYPDKPFEASQALGRSPSEGFKELAAAESGDIQARDAAIADRAGDLDWMAVSEHWDLRQDFWRWAGDRAQARHVIEQWSAEMPEDPWAYERLAEIQYLEGDFSAAVQSLSKAVDLFEAIPQESGHDFGDPLMARQYAVLQLGTAQDSAGDRAAALSSWAEASQPVSDYRESVLTAMKARAEAGAAALEAGDYRSSVNELTEAVAMGQPYTETVSRSDGGEELVLGGPLRGAELNNLALAGAKAGEHETAIDAATQAIQRDPANPVFLDTLAFVHHLSGDSAQAVQAYRSALGEDSSSYVSANNLAVLQAESGNDEEAKELLKDAVAAYPSYAYAWHNLGVLYGRSASPGSFLTGQGALAQAARIDRDLRGDVNTLLVDETVYDSGVDISRPVEPDWSYAASASEPARGFQITMLLLITLRIAWALGLDQASGWIAQKVSASSPRKGPSGAWFWSRIGAVWALLVTVLVLALPAIVGLPAWPAAVGIAMTCVLVATPITVRAYVARSSSVTHYGWTPAVAVGVAAAPFGISFAPYPAVDDAPDSDRWSVRWASSIAMATVVVVLTIVSIATSVPYMRTAAMMALVLLASILTPAPPFDGSKISSRIGQFALAGALAAASLAFAMKWI